MKKSNHVDKSESTFRDVLRTIFIDRWPLKLVAFALAILLWLCFRYLSL